MSFSIHQHKAWMSICPIMGTADHFLQGVLLCFPTAKLLFFSFAINTNDIEGYLECMKMTCFSLYFCSQVFTSMDACCLKQLTMVAN